MSGPEQATGHFASQDEDREPARTEHCGLPPEGSPGEDGPDRAAEWEAYDVAILDAVLDS